VVDDTSVAELIDKDVATCNILTVLLKDTDMSELVTTDVVECDTDEIEEVLIAEVWLMVASGVMELPLTSSEGKTADVVGTAAG